MKRKDFLRKMGDRRRGGAIEERHPEVRRKVDWRTLRVDLPGPDDPLPEAEATAVGLLYRRPGGVRLDATRPCWARGYRLYETDGQQRAEFQYRPVEPGSEPPPGAAALTPGSRWEPQS